MIQEWIILEWKHPFLLTDSAIDSISYGEHVFPFLIKLPAFSEWPGPVCDRLVRFSCSHSGAVTASTPTIPCDQSGHWHLPSESLSTNCSRVISCSRKHRPNYSVAERGVTVSTPCLIHQCWRQIISPGCLHPDKGCTEKPGSRNYLFGRPMHSIFHIQWTCILLPNVEL